MKVFNFESHSKHLKPLREELKVQIRHAGFSDKETESLRVALGEAVSNVIRHSYKDEEGHPIRLEYEELPDRLVFRLRDYGCKFNLEEYKEPELPPTGGGGLGVYFIKTIMDEVKYNTAHPDGNEVVLVKYKVKIEPA